MALSEQTYQVVYREEDGRIVVESEHDTFKSAWDRMSDFDSTFYTLFCVLTEKASDMIVQVIWPDDPDGFGIPQKEQVGIADVVSYNMTTEMRANIICAYSNEHLNLHVVFRNNHNMPESWCAASSYENAFEFLTDNSTISDDPLAIVAANDSCEIKHVVLAENDADIKVGERLFVD